MKKIWGILILILLMGCSQEAAAPAAEAAPTAAFTTAPSVTAAPTVRSEQITIGISATEPATPTPMASPTPSPIPEPTSAPTPAPLDGVIVGLDPGHQLNYDPAPEPVAPGSSETKQKVAGGCRGVKSGAYEYEVNLNVSLLLRDLLQEAGATVVMTHDVLDVNISNIQRAQMFNAAKVDLGLRLHCNKGKNSRDAGAFMIVPTEKRTKSYAENIRAAEAILAAYCEETGLSTRYQGGLTYRGDQTGFNWCERPIITIEMGHLSNPEEDALLSDPDFQMKMAQGLFNGILHYFRPDLVAAANE